MLAHKKICIFGGTGFLGHYVVQELARQGHRIKIITRYPESAYSLRPYGDVGQIVAVACCYQDDDLNHAIKECDVVINLVGILYEKGKNKFQSVHCDYPEKIAKICADTKIKQFIHVSALGVDKGISAYAKSKKTGEDAVLKAYPEAVILRPSIVFGPNDNFFNLFARLTAFLPCLPLIGGGQTKFQPVYAGDIALAIKNIIERQTPKKTEGNIFELGGSEIFTFKQLFEKLLDQIGKKTFLINIPWQLAKIQGRVLEFFPRPLLTSDQVLSLKTDNIIQPNALTLKDLGVSPVSIDSILPSYLKCYRKGGRSRDKEML